MRARRTELPDCKVHAGRHFLVTNGGIIIDCFGTSGTVLELVCSLSRLGAYARTADDAPEFVKKLAQFGIAENDLLREAASDMEGRAAVLIWNMLPEATNRRTVKTEDVYKLETPRLSREVSRKIYKKIEPGKILYHNIYSEAWREINSHIAARIRACGGIAFVREAVEGSLKFWEKTYSEHMRHTFQKREKAAYRHLLKKAGA